MKSPFVSIIIPCYNVEKYLRICMEGILKQSFKDWEVILIDDGSTDSTKSIIELFADIDARVNFYSQSNQGVSAARNLGLKYAKGEYVYFIDADDKADNDLLISIYNATQHVHPDLIVFGYRKVSLDNEILRVRIPAKAKLYKDEKEIGRLFSYLLDHELFNIPWNKIYQSELIRQNKLTFPKIPIGEDAIFNYQYYRVANNIQTLNLPLYSYVAFREGSATAKQNHFDMKLLRLLSSEKTTTMSFLGLKNHVVFETELISACYTDLKTQLVNRKKLSISKPEFYRIRKQITAKFGIIGTFLRVSFRNDMKLFLLFHIHIFELFVFFQLKLHKLRRFF